MDDLLQTLGRRIRDIRKQRGWSQAAASEQIGVHWTYLGHLERAEKPGVSLRSIARVAQALGVTLSQLFDGLEYGTEIGQLELKSLSKVDAPIRVGKNAIRIEKLLDELQVERTALREAVRTLKQLARGQEAAVDRPKIQERRARKTN